MRLQGLLFFPVTPFAADGEVAVDVLATHVADGVAHGAGAVFAACGTGEFHALSPEEHRLVVQTAVEATAGKVPVIAGVGGPLPTARSLARSAQDVGADGLLVLPPYLVAPTQAGLCEYVRATVESCQLPAVIYHRDNARFSVASAVALAEHPQIVGLKDGTGDIDLLHRIVRAVRAEAGEEFQFFNGMPTAELFSPAYSAIGVSLYSSAVFAFAPEIALVFHAALHEGDEDTVNHLIDTFYAPLVTLRHSRAGYAISLIKAGLRLRGIDAGTVRPPLSPPTTKDLDALAGILAAGLRASAGSGQPVPEYAATQGIHGR